MRTRCAPFRRAQFDTLGRLAKSHAEHTAVVTAVQRADADAAARSMRAHIIVVRSAVDALAGAVARQPREQFRGRRSELASTNEAKPR